MRAASQRERAGRTTDWRAVGFWHSTLVSYFSCTLLWASFNVSFAYMEASVIIEWVSGWMNAWVLKASVLTSQLFSGCKVKRCLVKLHESCLPVRFHRYQVVRQREGQSTKYLSSTLQNCQGHQNQGKSEKLIARGNLKRQGNSE